MFNKTNKIKEDVGFFQKKHYIKALAPKEFINLENQLKLKKLHEDIVFEAVNTENLKNFQADFVLSIFLNLEQLTLLGEEFLKPNQTTQLIVVTHPEQIVELGAWLNKKAEERVLNGVHLIVTNNFNDIVEKVPQYLKESITPNVIYLPNATGVENSGYKNFFVFSPMMQEVLFKMKSFADNGITRICLLGGPGIGKTSLAYYYYTVRNLGQFVAVNLAAENTGDKGAIKSLLCGHVSGAFPGAGSRNGAFTQARDGVCFLDESHQISGAVMEVLMEALEGQYMPYGASAKRAMECALLYATNRSWEHLQNAVNLDEFTRMGASVIKIPELHERKEDLIAVVASILANFSKKCKTWQAPSGLSMNAWQTLYNCRWYGNVRGLIRVLESSFEITAMKSISRYNSSTINMNSNLITEETIINSIKLWEPEKHHSHKIYYQEAVNQ